MKRFIKIRCNCDRELIHHSVQLLYKINDFQGKFGAFIAHTTHPAYPKTKTTLVQTIVCIIQLSFFTYKMNPNEEGILHSVHTERRFGKQLKNGCH